MRLARLTLLALPLIGGGALAQTYQSWIGPAGEQMPGMVLACPTGTAREATPCGGPSSPVATLGMPFQRAGDPFILPATTTAQTFRITQPEGTRSYRAINPCLNADVRVRTVAATATPITTEPTAYPGVERVTSATEAVTAVTGTRFMGRYGETLGSTANPIGGAARLVSIMIVAIPGATTDLTGVTCPFEIGYGMGG